MGNSGSRCDSDGSNNTPFRREIGTAVGKNRWRLFKLDEGEYEILSYSLRSGRYINRLRVSAKSDAQAMYLLRTAMIVAEGSRCDSTGRYPKRRPVWQ